MLVTLCLGGKERALAMRWIRWCLLPVLLWGSAEVALADISIDGDYPGGNFVLEGIEGDVVYVRQDLRDTSGWWFYWNFSVRNAVGRHLKFHFTDRNVLGTRGPAVSRDGGQSWAWLGTKTVQEEQDGVSFTHAFSAGEDAVRFAFSVPYQERDLLRFLRRHGDNDSLSVDTLCTSPQGRGVEQLRIGAPQGEPRYRILLTARHHCCESMASYVLEGIMDTMLARGRHGRWFQKNVEALVIPFIDKDGVEAGDQGKNRQPRDHGRDYAGESIYPSTGALRALAPDWSDGRLRIALDIHCPHIRGEYNEFVYLVGSADPEIWREEEVFSRRLESVWRTGLPYRASNNLAFGERWNTPNNYTAGQSMSAWAGEIPGVRLSASLEIPYANAGTRTVTPTRARRFGAALAKAMHAYLRNT